jgi:hypothetical protein
MKKKLVQWCIACYGDAALRDGLKFLIVVLGKEGGDH